MPYELDEVVVTGTRTVTMTDQEIQHIINGFNQGQEGTVQGGDGSAGGGGGETTDAPPTLAEIAPPTLEEILAAIRNFIASVSELDSVGNRDASTRFERNEQNQTTITLGSGEVAYFDNSTGSYWFDQNGNGTFETQFWIGTDGVWYDINNDGARDTLLSGV